MQVENNPLPPARPEILHKAGLEKDPKEYTLRDAVEWYKNVVSGITDLRPAEQQALTQSWVVLTNGIAEREGVPAGFLAYYLSQLVETELRLLQTAAAEAGLADV